MRNLLLMAVFENIGRRKLTDQRINPYLKVFLSIVLLVLLGVATGNAQTINFTGDVEADFAVDGVFVIDEGAFQDVGVPSQLPMGSISGWDIAKVYFFTNIKQLYIGVDYFGIAGDADGDGLPGTASAELSTIGGQDLPDMANSESLAIQMDLNQDGIFDVVSGVPGGDPPGGTHGCPNFDLNDCFGVYNYVNNTPAFSFLSLTGNTSNLFALPSSDIPDIEFNIENWDTLAGWDNVEANTCQTFEFDVQIFSGSFIDAGIGEEFIPSQSSTLTVSLEVCADCEGTIFGTTELDECGVCGGDNSSCSDCAGIPNGDTVVDECGVCGGDNSTCTVQPIPTLSEWGLISMAGILGIVGFMVIRRRKVTA